MRISSNFLISGTVLLLLSVVAFDVPARGDIQPIGPFAGDFHEGWESFDTYTLGPLHVNYLPDPTVILGGEATISSPVMAVYGPGAGFSFGLSSAHVAEGSKAMGLNADDARATIEFKTPVFNFGAYWGVASHDGFDPTPVYVSFFDPAAKLILSDSFTYSARNGGFLEWHGWTSETPIGSIAYTADPIQCRNCGFIAVDDLNASGKVSPPATVPEPSSTLLLLSIAAVLIFPPALAGRRRATSPAQVHLRIAARKGIRE